MLALTSQLEKKEESKMAMSTDQVSASPASEDGDDTFFECHTSKKKLSQKLMSKKKIAAKETELIVEEANNLPFEESAIIDPRRQDEILALARALQTMPYSDDYRAADAHKDGGFALVDQVILTKYRSALKDLIKQVGRMILSGKFELYKVSFPISCMSSRSILTAVSKVSLHAPTYMNAAAMSSDPI